MTLDPQRRLKPVGWRYRTTTAALLLGAVLAAFTKVTPGDPVSNLRGLAVAWTVVVFSAPLVGGACFGVWVYETYGRRRG